MYQRNKLNIILVIALLLTTNIELKNLKEKVLEAEEIVSVVEFNRHGARLSKGQTDEFLSKHFFGMKLMNLSTSGYLQHRILGNLIRNKYSKILSKVENFKAYSSPVQRTLFSAFGYLSGLYPDSIPQIEYEEEYLKIKYPQSNYGFYFPNKESYLFSQTDKKIPLVIRDSFFHPQNCLNYKTKKLLNKEYKDVTKDLKTPKSFKVEEEIEKSSLENLKPDFEIFKNNFSEDNDWSEVVTNFESLFYHFNQDINEKEKLQNLSKKQHYEFINPNIKLGSKIDHEKAVQIFNLKRAAKFWKTRINLSPEADAKMKLLVKEFYIYLLKNLKENSGNSNQETFTDVEEADAQRQYEKGKKFTLFSGHDTNIVNIFANLFDNDWILKNISATNSDFFVPAFASSLIFELVKSNNKYFVRIVYNGKILKERSSNDMINVYGDINNYLIKLEGNKQNPNLGNIPSNGLIPLDTFLTHLRERISKEVLDCSDPQGDDS